MSENYVFDESSYYEVADFGVFHLSVNEASKLIPKILCLEGELDIVLPDEEESYSLQNPKLDDLLARHFAEYRNILSAGIDKGTLETVHLSRNPDETIVCDETFVNTTTLVDWLQVRSINILGDWFEEYSGDELRVAEAAIHAIQIERIKIRNRERNDPHLSDDEKIVMLERRILSLESEISHKKSSNISVKPLHTKERETLLKLIIGMAVGGYAYDPNAKKSSTSKDIADDLAGKGMSIDQDTVRKWLNKAAELLPRDIDPPDR